jgi:uncharacterized membrane protein YbhN (UPF0104 family)
VVIAAAILVVAGVVLLIARAAGFGEVRAAIASADARWLAVCLAAQVLALGGYAAVLREAFRWRGGIEPGWGLSVQVMLASIGATRVVAPGGAGALAAAYWCFRRAGFGVREAIVRVLGFNMLFYVTFSVAAWAAAVLLAAGVGGDAPAWLTTPWIVLVPACLVAALAVTRPGRIERLARAEGGPFLRRALAYAIAGPAGSVRSSPTRPGGERSWPPPATGSGTSRACRRRWRRWGSRSRSPSSCSPSRRGTPPRCSRSRSAAWEASTPR